ncbi:uncharacterized protein LOC143075820 [Mytilus galloprovincialis]|uniref:uncharacterized protein LOC143075820 n=1 Tax=Mytilus galloprovincialis TaxID=29158 RepID=UPI003F7CA753
MTMKAVVLLSCLFMTVSEQSIQNRNADLGEMNGDNDDFASDTLMNYLRKRDWNLGSGNNGNGNNGNTNENVGNSNTENNKETHVGGMGNNGGGGRKRDWNLGSGNNGNGNNGNTNLNVGNSNTENNKETNVGGIGNIGGRGWKRDWNLGGVAPPPVFFPY